MLEVKFHDTADDSLLKFAVIISRYNDNEYYVNTKSVIHMNAPEDNVKSVKILKILPKKNVGKNPGQKPLN